MWDAFQREVLGAMGHTLLVPAASKSVEAPAPAPAPAPLTDVDARPALLRALAHAAGIDHAKDDISQRVVLPPLAELRTPAGKRSLWPRLRALRKAPPA